MSDTKENVMKMVDDLKRQRDELKVKLHLAKAEVKDEWDKLETKWKEIQGKVISAGKEAEQSAESISASLGLVVDEIKKGYERIRKVL